jgi:hypothetical protein
MARTARLISLLKMILKCSSLPIGKCITTQTPPVFASWALNLWAEQRDGGEALVLHPSNIHDNAYAITTIMEFTGSIMPGDLESDGPSLGGLSAQRLSYKS